MQIFIIIVLPFVLLVRGSVYLHITYGQHAYISLLGGILLTSLLLATYVYYFKARISRNYKDMVGFKNSLRISLLAGICYSTYGLFFLPLIHFQSPHLKKEIRQVHPLMRIAVSVIVLVDKELIITDASRTPADYREMGLPVKEKSLHYRQKDGFAYAIDIHTRSRNWRSNLLVKSYFRLMGFKVLRHGGTGDHFHISLYCHYSPYSS